MNVIIEENEISEHIKKFWQLESLGIEPKTQTSELIENKTLGEFKSNIKFKNKCNRVKLPWKTDTKDLLHDIREIALERFYRLNLRFWNNIFLYSEYKKVIDEYLSQNIIEPVLETETDQTVFYLPHRVMLREDKSTSRLRVVFDDSSHVKGKLSLNDCLHIGPNLYSNLYELLFLLRENPVAFISDIKQAFLQLEIAETDKDVTCFSGTDDPTVTNC